MERREKKQQDPFYEQEKVVSATECTGLMPSLPQSEDEDENFASLYATHDVGRPKPTGVRDIPNSPA